MSTPGTQVAAESEPAELARSPCSGSPVGLGKIPGGEGAPGGGPTGGDGCGTAGHVIGCCWVMVTPWSLTATGWPFTVTCPTTTWASAVPPLTVLVEIVSTVTLLTWSVPIPKFCTSECVVTRSTPSWPTIVR